jgi:hypothetical protein
VGGEAEGGAEGGAEAGGASLEEIVEAKLKNGEENVVHKGAV